MKFLKESVEDIVNEKNIEYNGYMIMPFTITKVVLGNKEYPGQTTYNVKRIEDDAWAGDWSDGDSEPKIKSFKTIEDAKAFIDGKLSNNRKVDEDFRLWGNEENLKEESSSHRLVSESLDEIILSGTNEVVNPDENLSDIQYGVLNTLNTLMQEELDAIQSYNDAIVQCTAAGYGEFVETLKSLASEETVHLGELQKLYDTIKGGTIAEIQDGQDEAQADLTTTEDQLN